MEPKVIIAIDTLDKSSLEKLLELFSGRVGIVKLGISTIYSCGLDSISLAKNRGFKVFADVKAHDIPSQVAKAVRALSERGADYITVHALGGADMLRAAKLALDEDNGDGALGQGQRNLPLGPELVAVTLLTSMSDQDLAQFGISSGVDRIILNLASVSLSCGIRNIVCSPRDLDILTMQFGSSLNYFVPGIRPSGEDSMDQKRFASPSYAVAHGASYLIVGRPIVESADPLGALAALESEIRRAC